MHQRLGLFGGTFDPPHKGHVAAAKCFLTQFQLCRLLIIPAGSPYHKAGTKAPAAVRAEMCSLAFAGIAGTVISRLDLERDGYTYTVDTVSLVKKQYPQYELWWLLGSDAFLGINTWHEVGRLAALTALAVVLRPGDDFAAVVGKNKSLAVPFRLQQLLMPPCAVNSTSLRAALHNPKHPGLKKWLPEKVTGYIEKTGLYTDKKG